MKIIGNKETIIKEIDKLKDKEYIVIITTKETKEQRTITQNNMFYGLFTQIGNHLGYKPEEVKLFFIKGLFGTKEIELFGQTQEISIINSTKDLNKEQGIFLIDSILEFIKTHDIPCKYTPKEIQSLYNSYN